jgi:hypothetical protein
VTATPNYANRIVAQIRTCVRLTPASWCQFADELSAPGIETDILWAHLEEFAGVELRADVKRDVLNLVWGEAAAEFSLIVRRVRHADQALAAEAAR